MTTKLDKPLKRELEVEGAIYTLTITPDGLNLVPKGKRTGYQLSWAAFINGDAAVATALNASLLKKAIKTPASRDAKRHAARTSKR